MFSGAFRDPESLRKFLIQGFLNTRLNPTVARNLVPLLVTYFREVPNAEEKIEASASASQMGEFYLEKDEIYFQIHAIFQWKKVFWQILSSLAQTVSGSNCSNVSELLVDFQASQLVSQ